MAPVRSQDKTTRYFYRIRYYLQLGQLNAAHYANSPQHLTGLNMLAATRPKN